MKNLGVENEEFKVVDEEPDNSLMNKNFLELNIILNAVMLQP